MKRIWRKYYSIRPWFNQIVERDFPTDFSAEMVVDFLDRINTPLDGKVPEWADYCYVKMSDAIEVPDEA